MRTRSFHLVLLALVLASLPILVPACVTREEALESRASAVAARDHLLASATSLELELASLPDNDPARPELEARLARSRTGLEALAAGVAQIDAAFNDPPTNSPAETFLDSLVALVPGPWQAPVLLGGAGFALFLRSRQLRQGITSIARGIEIAKREDPVFRESFERHANTFRSIQSPVARKLVDTVTSRPASRARAIPRPPESASTPSNEKLAATYSQE